MSLRERVQELRAEIETDKLTREQGEGLISTVPSGFRAEGQFSDRTFLYIKSFSGDDGSRPIAGGIVFWNSPSVELFDGNIPIPTNQLKAGKNYTIEVNIDNGGDLEAASCIVDLFICDPALGFVFASAKQIGIQHVEAQPHKSTKVYFNLLAGPEHIGHRCLFARVYSFSTRDFPAKADAFETVNDRHIGQQNLSIVTEGELMKIDFSIFIHLHVLVSLTRRNELLPTFERFEMVRMLKAVDRAAKEDFQVMEAKDTITEDTTPAKKDQPLIRIPKGLGKPGGTEKMAPKTDLKVSRINIDKSLIEKTKLVPAKATNQWKFDRAAVPTAV